MLGNLLSTNSRSVAVVRPHAPRLIPAFVVAFVKKNRLDARTPPGATWWQTGKSSPPVHARCYYGTSCTIGVTPLHHQRHRHYHHHQHHRYGRRHRQPTTVVSNSLSLSSSFRHMLPPPTAPTTTTTTNSTPISSSSSSKTPISHSSSSSSSSSTPHHHCNLSTKPDTPSSSSSSSPAAFDDAMMRQALIEARKAYTQGEVPVGAILVDSTGHIIARGHNRVEAEHDCTRHAEMVCLQAAMRAVGNWRLTNCTLYCTLEPCAMCLSAVLLARVRRVVYGAADVRLGACGSWIDLVGDSVDGDGEVVGGIRHPFHVIGRENVTAGVLGEEVATLMKEFFRMRRRQNKERQKMMKMKNKVGDCVEDVDDG